MVDIKGCMNIGQCLNLILNEKLKNCSQFDRLNLKAFQESQSLSTYP